MEETSYQDNARFGLILPISGREKLSWRNKDIRGIRLALRDTEVQRLYQGKVQCPK